MGRDTASSLSIQQDGRQSQRHGSKGDQGRLGGEGHGTTINLNLLLRARGGDPVQGSKGCLRSGELVRGEARLRHNSQGASRPSCSASERTARRRRSARPDHRGHPRCGWGIDCGAGGRDGRSANSLAAICTICQRDQAAVSRGRGPVENPPLLNGYIVPVKEENGVEKIMDSTQLIGSPPHVNLIR